MHWLFSPEIEDCLLYLLIDGGPDKLAITGYISFICLAVGLADNLIMSVSTKCKRTGYRT